MPQQVSITCGHCSLGVSATVVSGAFVPSRACALLCPSCEQFTSISKTEGQSPAPVHDFQVGGLPPDVENAWSEAVRSFSIDAYTASEMMCRKILMHVAVDVAGSKEKSTFGKYIDDLDEKRFITAGLRSRVDEIRTRGNTLNHELPASTGDQALRTLSFTRHLLSSIYEFTEQP